MTQGWSELECLLKGTGQTGSELIKEILQTLTRVRNCPSFRMGCLNVSHLCLSWQVPG